MERGSPAQAGGPRFRVGSRMAKREHATCTWCQAGWRLRGTMHVDDEGAVLEPCSATCAACGEPIVQGDLLMVVNTPDGPRELHQRCMR